MKGTHLFLIVNTSTLLKTELHLTKLVPVQVCYRISCVFKAGSPFQCYHTLVPGINSIFLENSTGPFKVNLRNHCVTSSVNIYLCICHHFENEHHFELESIKNEFIDLDNLLKHVLHIESSNI